MRHLLPLALVGLIACGDGSTTPPVDDTPRATAVEIQGGAGQSTLVGSRLPDPIVVKVTDQAGLPFRGATVEFRPSGNGEVDVVRTVTGPDGRADTRWTLGTAAGTQTLSVIVAGITGQASVTAEGMVMASVDVVRVDGLGTTPHGTTASGTTEFGQLFAHRALGSEGVVDVGDFRAAGTERSEVVFYARGTFPTLVPDAWTDEADEIVIEPREAVSVPVTVWVMNGPFDSTRDLAARDLAATTETFDREGLAMVFDDVEFKDATGANGVGQLLAFNCGLRASTEDQVGHDEGRLNFYYVSTVDGGRDRGVTCPIGGNFVAMAEGVFPDLLAHEIGHMFGRFHIDSYENFGRENIMHSASSTRRYWTEGQIFRAAFDSRSALMGELGLVAEELTRPCGGQFDSATCAAVDVRVFDDGGIIAGPPMAAMASTAPVVLSALDDVLLDRCSTDDPTDRTIPTLNALELERTFREGPSEALDAYLTRTLDPGAAQAFRTSIRGEALRLMVLQRAPGVEALMQAALDEDAQAFGPTVEWGREFIRR